jgi:hypothetical protein
VSGDRLDEQPMRVLAGGARMPVLGLGVWQLAAGAELAPFRLTPQG